MLIGSVGRGFGPVCLNTGLAVVGAPGGAHIFRSTNAGWTEEAIVRPSDNVGQFGWSLSLDEDALVVGAWGNPWAYLFRFDGEQWLEADKLIGIDGFGRPVSIDGKYAAVVAHVYAVREHRNLRDLANFQNCFGAHGAFQEDPICNPFDLPQDGRFDLADFENFVGTFVGPHN
jgi:hypothetical protein